MAALLGAAILISLTGCSLFGGGKPAVEVTQPVVEQPAPDTTVAAAPVMTPPPAPAKKSGSTGKHGSSEPPAASPPPASEATGAAVVPAPPDTTVRVASVTAMLTVEQRSVREAQYRDDVDRARRALDIAQTKSLTDEQHDQLKSAERFLLEGREAWDVDDLIRACSLAEKARIIAEELKTGTGSH